MLGLASFIGLSDRDRFELSGDTLKRWLEHSDQAKEILIDSEAKRKSRRDGGPDEEPEDGETADPDRNGDRRPPARTEARTRRSLPRPRREAALTADLPFPLSATAQAQNEPKYAPALGVSAIGSSLDALATLEIDTLVLARGFEDRALASAERVLAVARPRRIILVYYSEDQGVEIAQLVRRLSIPCDVVTTTEEMSRAFGEANGALVVDSSGLSKAFLFVAARDALSNLRRVTIVHTLADQYYPRNEDLRARGISASHHGAEIFESLQDLLVGEAGPYRLTRVHECPAEPERWRALLASASPKNDRLLHLLDTRTYDAARILVPPPTSERRRIARAAAELAASAADSNVGLIEVDTNDIHAALRESVKIYNDLYFGSGANVEIGLTGSKIHAVAFAALAAAGRIASAWYVSPQTFDMQRFTTGVGDTRCFDLLLDGAAGS
jgi:hypothetical protein